MLLDEPFGQLNAQTRLFMEKKIERIWVQEKGTIIFFTNNIDESILLGDRIFTIEGKLPGRMHEVYQIDIERPRELTAMDFSKIRQKIIEESELVL